MADCESLRPVGCKAAGRLRFFAAIQVGCDTPKSVHGFACGPRMSFAALRQCNQTGSEIRLPERLGKMQRILGISFVIGVAEDDEHLTPRTLQRSPAAHPEPAGRQGSPAPGHSPIA
jgi:hypothetical protein